MSGIIEAIVEDYPDEEILKADGFDDAVIGVANIMNSPPRLVYSISKILDILVSEEGGGMTYEDAREHFDFNIGGAYVGENTPIYVEDHYGQLEAPVEGDAVRDVHVLRPEGVDPGAAGSRPLPPARADHERVPRRVQKRLVRRPQARRGKAPRRKTGP